MKRTSLQRKTPLVAKKPMARGKGFQQGAAKKPKPKKGGGPNAGLDALKQQARRRDEDTCVKCGLILAGSGNVHHRRNRGQGGSRKANVISNLITLCGTPLSGCHGDVTLHPWEFDAEENGWVLSTNGKTDPATEPVNVSWLGWAYPLADGTWRAIEDITAVAS